MSSILDHVEQAVPRATVYGAMRGSPVFIGKYFREVNPASNATDYQWSKGERRISFVVASPDKTIFNDLRSAYLKLDISGISSSSTADANGTIFKITEPASNFIERIVIKMNGTVIEDISRFDYLTSFFKRKLLTRDQKNARTREGWDWVSPAQASSLDVLVAADIDGAAQDAEAAEVSALKESIADASYIISTSSDAASTDGAIKIITQAINSASILNTKSLGAQVFGPQGQDTFTTVDSAVHGTTSLCLKLDLSGIMNIQQLLSGYYSPLEIDLYLQDPRICCNKRGYSSLADYKTTTVQTAYDDVAVFAQDYTINRPRLCIDQIVMSPEYVSAFEAALLSNSSAQGIQIPFTTYYSYKTSTKGGAQADGEMTYWVRKPVRYLKGIYWGAIQTDKENALFDSYRFQRISTSNNSVNQGVLGAAAADNTNYSHIPSYQISIGTKTYREITDFTPGQAENQTARCYESDVHFAKAVGHYNDYSTEDASLNPFQRVLNNQTQGIDLEFSPDNDVLSSETTLNSNDVRFKIKYNINGTGPAFGIYSFLQYQASVALFPGNETRLLVT